MAMKTETTTINGLSVVVSTFPGRQGLKYKNKVLRIIGPSLSSLLGKLNIKTLKNLKNIMNSDLDLSTLGIAIERLVEKMDEDAFIELAQGLLSCTKINGKEAGSDASFDMLFAGDFPFLYKVIFFVIKVNYGSFLSEGGIGTLIQEAQEEAAKSLTPPSNQE